MSNVFAPKESPIQLKSKGTSTPGVAQPVAPQTTSGVSLPPPKPRRKQHSLYLDTGMMDRVKLIAQRRGVSIGAVIEACVKNALDQMEG